MKEKWRRCTDIPMEMLFVFAKGKWCVAVNNRGHRIMRKVK